MSFRIITAGAGFEPVILVSPADAEQDMPGVKYYRYSDREIDNFPSKKLNEIDKETVRKYFNGHADGLGLEEIPKQVFLTEDEVLQFIKLKKRGLV